MVEMLVWMLISVSDYGNSGYSGSGVTTVVGHFKTQEQCAHVLKHIPKHSTLKSCVQTNILLPK